MATALNEDLKKVEKRADFLRNTKWEEMHHLLCNAGLLVTDDAGHLTVETERMAAMVRAICGPASLRQGGARAGAWLPSSTLLAPAGRVPSTLLLTLSVRLLAAGPHCRARRV